MDEASRREPLIRLPIGVPGLDRVLHGGMFRGGLYMIQGEPGAGKTILSNPICFHHIGAGGRAVYVTLLAELHTRMLAHLQPLQFSILRQLERLSWLLRTFVSKNGSGCAK